MEQLLPKMEKIKILVTHKINKFLEFNLMKESHQEHGIY